MDLIVKTTARILFPFILLFGIYIAVHGHLSPGGGFPAGVVIATSFVMLVISYPKEEMHRIEKRFEEKLMMKLKSAAGFALIGIILIWFLIKTSFKIPFDILATQTPLHLWSGGWTPALNLATATLVATALIIITYSLIKEEWKVEEVKR
jgi:multicomponent Na+:H+ antiporter subunit B